MGFLFLMGALLGPPLALGFVHLVVLACFRVLWLELVPALALALKCLGHEFLLFPTLCCLVLGFTPF